MRYTTIIDITEIPSIYKNQAARMIYLHLVLKSGYHDQDRDLIQVSIRSLARDTGLTIAAVRHALQQLEKFQLIARRGTWTKVRKFIVEQPITKRASTKKLEDTKKFQEIREAESAARAAEREKYEKEQLKLAKQGKNSFMIYYEELLKRAEAGDLQAAADVRANEKAYNEMKVEMEKKKAALANIKSL